MISQSFDLPKLEADSRCTMSALFGPSVQLTGGCWAAGRLRLFAAEAQGGVTGEGGGFELWYRPCRLQISVASALSRATGFAASPPPAAAREPVRRSFFLAGPEEGGWA